MDCDYTVEGTWKFARASDAAEGKLKISDWDLNSGKAPTLVALCTRSTLMPVVGVEAKIVEQLKEKLKLALEQFVKELSDK